MSVKRVGGVGGGGGGLLPLTSERFPEGIQNTLVTSVEDPRQLLFFPLRHCASQLSAGDFFSSELINSAENWS